MENSTVAGIWSGSVNQSEYGYVPPPTGMRSAVPLGGLGAGTFEIRADGTMHMATLMNQSPAGSALFGTLEHFLTAARVTYGAQGSTKAVTRALQTAPPSYASGLGVDALSYGGAYPLSRWHVQDAALAQAQVGLSLFAYTPLRPGNITASEMPAAAFTLVANNTGSQSSTVSFFVSQPFAAVNDCSRVSSNVISVVPGTASAAACLQACAATAMCASWTLDASANCTLAADVPLSVYAQDFACGVAGNWTFDASQLTFSQMPAAEVSAQGPAAGSVTLRPVQTSPSVQISCGASMNPRDLFSSFQKTGAVTPLAPGAATDAGYGACTVTAVVPAGSSVSLSVVMSWYFPNKDYYGTPIGNRYANDYASSQQVAALLGSPAPLLSAVQDINTFHSVFAGPLSPLPVWLQDMAINMHSHFRSMIATADGRMREFEANDSPVIDNIHNDYQRHLIYAWSFPEFEIQKLRTFAAIGQAADGHMQEHLGPFGPPLDQPGGRIMGDTTSIWIIELLQMYRLTGNATLVQELYPALKAAINWQLNVSATYGLPEYLICSYDVFGFDKQPTNVFNGVIHLTAMQAGYELAKVMSDSATMQSTQTAVTTGQAALQSLLWNATAQYYRAYPNSSAVFGDSLYGQVLSSAWGLGWQVDPTKVSKHLAMELKQNLDTYGLVVMTGRGAVPVMEQGAELSDVRSLFTEKGLHEVPFPAQAAADESSSQRAMRPALQNWSSQFADPRGQRRSLGSDNQFDDTLWQGAAPTWTALQLFLLNGGQPASAAALTYALEPLRRQVWNQRDRLRDPWNLAGLYTTDLYDVENKKGQPYVSSHYGFALPAYYSVLAYSGQQVNLAAGTLSFAPIVSCPYSLPVLLAGSMGTLSCSADKASYTLSMAFGELTLPAAGLSVSGKTCQKPVSLSAGQSISW
jgi:non-lysosomal glucosylceramidase